MTNFRKLALLFGIRGAILKKLESADETLYVVNGDYGRAFGIDIAQFIPKLLRAVLFHETVPSFADRIVHLLALRELIVIDGCAYVKTGSPGQNATMVRPINTGECISCVGLEQSRGKRFAGIHQVEAVMCDLALALRQLPGADVHSPIYLHGIGAYNLALQLKSNFLGKIGLAGCRWADDADNRML